MFGTTGGGEADVTSAGNFCHLFAATTANTAAGAITSNPIATAATSFSTTAADVALSTLPPPPLVSCALTDANVVSSIFSMSCATLAPPTSPPTTSSSSSAALNNALLFNSVVNATASVALSPPSVAPPPPPPPPTAGTFSAEAIGRLFNELLQKQQELSNQAAAVGANAALPLTSAMLSQQPASLLGAQHYQLSAATLPPRAIRQGGGDASFPLFQFPAEPLNSISATTLVGRPPSQPQQQQMSAPSYPPPPSYAEALLHEQQEQNRLLLRQMEAIAAAASMTTSTTATPTSNHCTAVTQHDQQQQRQLLLNKPIMSPDISRLAADTTAVSLTDKSEETVVERSTPGCSTTSQDSRATCIDETPLDLSTRSKTYSSSSSSCSSGNTHSQPPKPSTSSQSRQNTPPQLLTPPMKGPLRASLKHIKQGQFGGFGTPTCSGGSGGGGGGGGSTSGGKSIEVKRSASSVTYRAFDPDVSEHFRRSLSGKWPRRQLNYASYYKEGDPHHHHLVDEEEDYYSPTAEIRPPQSITSNAVPTTSTTTNGSGGVGELSAAKTAPPSSRFNALFSRKPFWRKTSTASSSSGAVSPSPDGKVMLTASAAASPSPLSVLDERSAITTGVANNSLLMDQQCQRVPSASSVSSTSGLTTTTPKKLSSSGTNVMTKIIVNEARQVEDHFRMALGEKTFQLLKSAQQKSLTPTPNSRRLMNGETRPTPPPPPQSSSGEPFSSASDYGVDGCANYANPELFHTPTTTTRAQQQLVVAGLNSSSGHDGACNNNGANEMMCISRL